MSYCPICTKPCSPYFTIVECPDTGLDEVTIHVAHKHCQDLADDIKRYQDDLFDINFEKKIHYDIYKQRLNQSRYVKQAITDVQYQIFLLQNDP